MPEILDGSGIDALLHGETTDPLTYLRRFYPELEIPPLAQVAERTVPLLAQIRHGYWLASCPCGARGVPAPGGVVWLRLPLVWCVRCENDSVGGRWRPVWLPPPAERTAIEAVLALRPHPEDRNWESGETLADLIAQNRAHGDPVPDGVA